MVESMIGSTIGSILAVAVLSAALAVRGSGDCPSPAQVSALLPDLLAPAVENFAETASVDAEGGDLVITVRGADGSLRLTRRIARLDGSPRSCAALAAAAAVVIATWEIERNAQLSLLQPGVYPPEPPPPVSPEPLAIEAGPAPAPAPPPAGSFLLGAAFGTSAGALGFTDTAQIETAGRAPGWPFGVSLTLAADGQRDQALAGGTVAWRRMTAGLGPWWALAEKALGVEVGAQLFLGWTSVSGSGFGVNRTDGKVSPGLDAAVRIVASGTAQTFFEPFLEATGRVWFAPQDLTVVQAGQEVASSALPRVEGRLTMGFRFQLAR